MRPILSALAGLALAAGLAGQTIDNPQVFSSGCGGLGRDIDIPEPPYVGQTWSIWTSGGMVLPGGTITDVLIFGFVDRTQGPFIRIGGACLMTDPVWVEVLPIRGWHRRDYQVPMIPDLGFRPSIIVQPGSIWTGPAYPVPLFGFGYAWRCRLEYE